MFRSSRGFTLSLYQRYDEAVHEFEDAIRINPNFFDAYYYFARSRFALRDLERSAELFRMAAKVRLEDLQSPLLLSQPLRMLRRTEEASEVLREGIHRAENALVLNRRPAIISENQAREMQTRCCHGISPICKTSVRFLSWVSCGRKNLRDKRQFDGHDLFSVLIWWMDRRSRRLNQAFNSTAWRRSRGVSSCDPILVSDLSTSVSVIERSLRISTSEFSRKQNSMREAGAATIAPTGQRARN